MIYRDKNPIQVAVTSYGLDVKCGAPGKNINIDTSVAYWRDFIEETLSFYNLRGSKPPARLNTLQYKCYSGPVIKIVKLSAWKCCDTCRALTAPTICRAWTHRQGANTCTLMTSKGKVSSSDTCTSGYYK